MSRVETISSRSARKETDPMETVAVGAKKFRARRVSGDVHEAQAGEGPVAGGLVLKVEREKSPSKGVCRESTQLQNVRLPASLLLPSPRSPARSL